MALIPDRIPGERLLKKIWQTVTERGIGGLLSPWQIRRVGKAQAEVRAHELRLLAQARRDAAEIKAGRKLLDEKGRVVDATTTQPEEITALPQFDITRILEQIRFEQTVRELERAQNLLTTITMAEEEAASVHDQEVSDKPVDPDWFTRWRANVEDVGSEEMQRLWARILAGEVKQPGSFSLHTLDFMRRLSKEDAHLIEKMAPFVSQGFIVHPDHFERPFEKIGLAYDTMLELQDLGILSGVEVGLSQVIPSTSTDHFFAFLLYGHMALHIRGDIPTMILSLHAYNVTRMGNQVLSLGRFEPNYEYISAVARLIQNRGFRVTLADVDYTGESVHFHNERPFPPLNP
jgi:hypothetical protein